MESANPRASGLTHLSPIPQRPKARHISSVHNPYSAPLTPDQLLTVDTSLASAVAALVHHLSQPLAPIYPHATILSLRSTLTSILADLFAPSWRPLDPLHGTGFRSLICTRALGLPTPLVRAAKHVGVDQKVWIQALKGKPREDSPAADRERDEWEVWCDPGSVCWRYGDWKYFDSEFDPIRPLPESTLAIWQAAPDSAATGDEQPRRDTFETSPISLTPQRPSAAIPIRAPAMSFIPPTPANATGNTTATVPEPLSVPVHFARPPSPTLMPAAAIGSAHSRSSSAAYSHRSHSPNSTDVDEYKPHTRGITYPITRQTGASGHRSRISGSDSTSSIASSVSDAYSGATQLLTPASRPGSADPFTAAAAQAGHSIDLGSDKTPTPGSMVRGRDPSPVPLPDQHASATPGATPRTAITPSVTPYDGGNVTVLGGGVKLGGGSRPASVLAQHRTPIDRSRSPSISLASRALNSALSPSDIQPGAPGRKSRTRRRIMPTYLGYVGQPGVGGPVPHAFQPMGLKGMTPLQGVPGQPGQASQPGQPGQISPMGQIGMGMGWLQSNSVMGGGMPAARQPLSR